MTKIPRFHGTIGLLLNTTLGGRTQFKENFRLIILCNNLFWTL